MHSSYDLRQNNSDTVKARSRLVSKFFCIIDQSDRHYIPFRSYFEQIYNIFARDGYEIWIKNEDFHRCIAAVVVKRSDNANVPTVPAVVWLKYGGFPIDNPLKQEIIDEIRENLALNKECVYNAPAR
jgi:hypothetical protein